MRLLIDIVVIAAVVYFGWDTPWSERIPALNKATPVSRTHAPRPQAYSKNPGSPAGAPSAPVATPLGVDQPAYNKNRSFTGHIYYVDASSGKRYWIDAQGSRHYEP